MHAGRISKHNRSTKKEEKGKKERKKRWRFVFTLLASQSPDRDAALEHLAVHGPGKGRGLQEKISKVKGEVVCGNTLYTLYTVVAAAEGGSGQSPWAL